MTVLFMDSADHYNNGVDMYTKWTAGVITTFTTGRNGNCFGMTWGDRYIYKSFSAYDNEWTFGTAYYCTAISTVQAIMRFRYDTTVQCSLGITNGRLIAYRGNAATQLAQSDVIFDINTWHYLEMQVNVNNTGTFVVHYNGDEVINYSGDTQAHTSPGTNDLYLQGANATQYFDDMYLLNNLGDAPQNDFLGDIKVEVLLPDSSGTYAQWTPNGAASNYLCVDDATPDDDTTYTSATGSSMKDVFSMDDSSVGDGIVYGIQALLFARKDDAGDASIEMLARINGTDYTLGTGSFALNNSYNYCRVIEETNPNTSGSWGISDINSMEFGYNRSA